MVQSIMASCPGPEATKQPWAITPPAACVTVPFMKCCVSLKKSLLEERSSKKFNLCLISPQMFAQKSLGSRDFVSFWSALISGTLFLWVHFSSLFFIVESKILTLTEASETWGSLEVVVGSFWPPG